MSNRTLKGERKKRAKIKRRKRTVFIILELVVLLVLSVVAYGMTKYDKLDVLALNEDKLEIYKDIGEYTNIAVFGLDSRDGEIDNSVNSDTIIICSINNETQDVKLTSVFRDTLLQQEDGSYEKANSAYQQSVEGAISLLNRNLDLDIKNYVSVNMNALVDVIDALGGIEVNMTAEEAFYTNGYASETAQITGKEFVKIKEEAGSQLLDGCHAVGYTRIRYLSGDDFKRTERQRFMIDEVIKKAKKANLFTLNKIVNEVFPQVSTNMDLNDILGYAANLTKFNIVESSGFPYNVTTSDDVYGHSGDYVIPIGLADNVKQLHQKVFGEDDYQPSDKVMEIDEDIKDLTGIYEDTPSVNTEFERDENNATTQ
ncbi:MAG: LCP family protein [Suipraeoptans sp.]